jgi:hypothetical protein
MLKAANCTLFSGGHIGAESFFGECAERWGVKEVTFSFPGHFIKREKNIIILSDEELKHGDISMDIVSLHMHRQYHQADQIRRVCQATFHMVSKGSQIFAVGSIMEDDTVKGGTGWGVELGKLFNRNVHVFDKTRHDWYTWRNGLWMKDLPKIIEPTFCGTGTRELTDESIAAIASLFERSFGSV